MAGLLDDLHDLSPNLCDTGTIFVYIHQLSSHCVFIFSNLH